MAPKHENMLYVFLRCLLSTNGVLSQVMHAAAGKFFLVRYARVALYGTFTVLCDARLWRCRENSARN